MKGLFVHCDSGSGMRQEIIDSKILGRNDKPIGNQFPQFKDIPLVYCSFFCEGYEKAYSESGIIFETDSPVIYACPLDAFELMREGNYIPGHERFVFSSIEAMLSRYPRLSDFKKDFSEYFKSLDPASIYPHRNPAEAKTCQRLDYSQRLIWLEAEGHNEITFRSKMKIKTVERFDNNVELKRRLKSLK
jgi:hypothetical protein